MELKLLTFRETPAFIKLYDAQLKSKDTLFALQSELLENPDLGDLMQGTGGARKGRIAEPGSGRGKSGSYRYVYVHFEKHDIIYLLFFYPKGTQANLTKAQKETVKKSIGEARKNLGG